jgi:uroporphyrinogen decarboxylase
MRQAGRSLPEYRDLRRGRTLMELARTPELAAEVTLQPVRRHGVDAAILFSDIVVPLAAVGMDVEIQPGVGPVVAQPVRTAADVRRLRPLQPDDDLPELAETVRLLCSQLDVPLIGFAGGPFTLASYLIEGGPSKAQARTKALMLSDPALFDELLHRLAGIAAAALRAQVEAGAAVVQVFDSWIGSLSREQYERHVAPAAAALLAELADLAVPRIAFGIGTGHLLEAIGATGPDAIGLDWRTPLSEARRRLGPAMPLQGNLDPTALLAPWSVARAEAVAVLADAPPRGYVFNLGHGVLPDTPAEVPGRIVELVHEHALAMAA